VLSEVDVKRFRQNIHPPFFRNLWFSAHIPPNRDGRDLVLKQANKRPLLASFDD
jgi:hypothetical protein